MILSMYRGSSDKNPFIDLCEMALPAFKFDYNAAQDNIYLGIVTV